ncbi:MAG: (2Fe-2S)-binding protein [Deltaproteobacteria bacterium]|nr:(2Fe-2S)-binding protein [Deltaproteobacteria bacterium]MBL7212697.1 (2Fe-2S)-binding protein [Desulfobacteraceae bacterium]
MSETTYSYFCPYCVLKYDSFEALKSHVLEQHKAQPLPTPEGQIHLTINGQEYHSQVEPEWTLYYLIHEKIGFTGTKMFCDRGACNSCTVIMDGRPILSCMTLAIECDGKTIETVEGIESKKHPLIEAYVRNHAMQCGYCTPGFVVTAKAFLDREPNPTEEEIRDALAGNLCRCGTYPQHPKAVLEAARKLKESGKRGASEHG